MPTYADDPRWWTREPRAGGPRPIVLLFPGQGSQYEGMATGLYKTEAVFAAAMDEVFALMGPDGVRIRSDWLGETTYVHIDDVQRAQPLLFAIDYALAQLLFSWGVRPTAVLGHSAGEMVAATLSGVFSLPDAVRSQMDRVRQAVPMPPGGMLAVAGTEEAVRPYLCGEVAMAAVNAARQVMLAGPADELQAVEDKLRLNDFTVAIVPATTPFHSPAMAPAARALEAGLAGIVLNQPAQTIYSGYTGELLTAKDSTRPEFWAWQVVDTVYFGPALDRLLNDVGDCIMVEVGPGQTLSAFARRHRQVRSKASEVIAMLPIRDGDAGVEREGIRAVAALIWSDGHEIAV